MYHYRYDHLLFVCLSDIAKKHDSGFGGHCPVLGTAGTVLFRTKMDELESILGLQS